MGAGGDWGSPKVSADEYVQCEQRGETEAAPVPAAEDNCHSAIPSCRVVMPEQWTGVSKMKHRTSELESEGTGENQQATQSTRPQRL